MFARLTPCVPSLNAFIAAELLRLLSLLGVLLGFFFSGFLFAVSAILWLLLSLVKVLAFKRVLLDLFLFLEKSLTAEEKSSIIAPSKHAE